MMKKSTGYLIIGVVLLAASIGLIATGINLRGKSVDDFESWAQDASRKPGELDPHLCRPLAMF